MEPKTKEITIIKSVEPWGEVTLADGCIIRTRLNVAAVYRLLDEDDTPTVDETGEPLYSVMHRVVFFPMKRESA